MRISKAKRQINTVLWTHFIIKDLLKEATLEDIQKRLKKIEPAIKTMYKKAMLDYPDDRSGEETYGYSGVENIKTNLIYVSDRWNCAFRLRWLLDLITLKDFKEKI